MNCPYEKSRLSLPFCVISSPLNHLRYVIASETEWNEAIAADSAITSLGYRCVRNDKYLSRHDISPEDSQTDAKILSISLLSVLRQVLQTPPPPQRTGNSIASVVR
ncbi:hypothetical protein [Nostoc sp.]|uniref:hypothetical protein n=1 Tax=Nostoc sp. TaxID=1180 RepID=UPI002FF8D31A